MIVSSFASWSIGQPTSTATASTSFPQYESGTSSTVVLVVLVLVLVLVVLLLVLVLARIGTVTTDAVLPVCWSRGAAITVIDSAASTRNATRPMNRSVIAHRPVAQSHTSNDRSTSCRAERCDGQRMVTIDRVSNGEQHHDAGSSDMC
jgi:hypothetical protein